MNGLCERCVQGGVLEGESTGRLEGSAYLAPGSGSGPLSDNNSKTCLVLLTDIFGLPLNNSKLIADAMAKQTGVDVWVPDVFDGKPPVGVNDLNDLIQKSPEEGKGGFLRILKFIVFLLPRLPLFIRSRPAVCDQRVKKFVESLRNDKGYSKIGAFGYCWGGGIMGRLGTRQTFDAGVMLHPANLSRQVFQAIDIPMSFAVAEVDETFPPSYANEIEAMFTEKRKNGGPDFEFKHYQGVCHGFAARPFKENPVAMERFEEAFTQTAAWLEKSLKEPET